MKKINQNIKILFAVLVGVTLFGSLAHAQENNQSSIRKRLQLNEGLQAVESDPSSANLPKKLPLCPKPDNSKKTDIERFAKWSNCWGRYKFELDSNQKGDVLEGVWVNGALHGEGTYTYANGDKYVGEFNEGNQSGQGVYTKTEATLEKERKLLEIEKEKEKKRLNELASKKINLQVTHSVPGPDGRFFINVQTNAITSSLQINGDEVGNRKDTSYIIQRVAIPGQSSLFKVVGTDLQGNTETQIVVIDLSTVKTNEAKSSPPKKEAEKTIDLVNDFKFSSKHFVPKLKDLKSCDAIDPKVIEKVLYVWMTVDANIDKNSAAACLDQESKYLNKLITSFNKKSSDSELASDSSKYQRRSSHIKEHIKELSAANCVWKSLDALNEPIREKAKSDINKLDEQGLTLLLAFQSDETAINLDVIYNNFKENKYNLAAVFKRVNSYLSDNSIDFKNIYLKRDSAAEAAKRKLNRQVELEKARKTGRHFDSSFEKLNNSLMAATSMQFKVFVPHRLEFLATGTCPSDDSPSLMANYMENFSK